MTNISGLDIKREIIKSPPKDIECAALLSGFVRACMTLSITHEDGLMLQLDCQTDFVREYISVAMLQKFKVSPKPDVPMLMYSDCKTLLRLLGIFKGDGEQFELTEVPDMPYNVESAYLRGVFLGCGSFSARETDGNDGAKGGGGYHLEFSTVSDSFADRLIRLLWNRGISVHNMTRADKCVVYAKDSENVCNILALMKLGKFVLKLNDTVVALSIKKDVNRRMNCDIANMTRTANAAVDVSDAIEYISAHCGLNLLPPKLVEAADARLNSPEASIGDLAYELGISKSGLKHRFDKIIEYANKLKATEQQTNKNGD